MYMYNTITPERARENAESYKAFSKSMWKVNDHIDKESKAGNFSCYFYREDFEPADWIVLPYYLEQRGFKAIRNRLGPNNHCITAAWDLPKKA